MQLKRRKACSLFNYLHPLAFQSLHKNMHYTSSWVHIEADKMLQFFLFCSGGMHPVRCRLWMYEQQINLARQNLTARSHDSEQEAIWPPSFVVGRLSGLVSSGQSNTSVCVVNSVRVSIAPYLSLDRLLCFCRTSLLQQLLYSYGRVSMMLYVAPYKHLHPSKGTGNLYQTIEAFKVVLRMYGWTPSCHWIWPPWC